MGLFFKTYKILFYAKWACLESKRVTYIRARNKARAIQKLEDKCYPEHISVLDIREVED